MDGYERDAALRALGQVAKRADRGVLAEKRRLLRTLVHPHQLGVIEDRSRLIAVRTPTRAGKSQAICAKALDLGLQVPRAMSLLFALIRDQAKKIFYDELLEWAERLKLDVTPRYADLEIHLPNRHRILIRGAESDADIEKWRGWKLAFVGCDEAASFHLRLKWALQKVLQPRLADLRGTFLMAGSPGEILDGTFYAVTCPGATTVRQNADGTRTVLSRPYARREAADWASFVSIYDRAGGPEAPQTQDEMTWSLHEWTRRDNTFLPHLWQESLYRKAANGWSDDNPIFLREDCGIWAAGESSLVYRFDAARNLWEPKNEDKAWESLPTGHTWSFLVGADIGGNIDPFAIEVAAFAESHPWMHQVYEFEALGISFQAFFAKLREVYDLFGGLGLVEAVIGDFDRLGDAALLELQEEYGVPIEKAAKKDKRDHIGLVNGDLIEGLIKLLPSKQLRRQMGSIQWDDKNPLKEKPQPHNDCADSWVYLWRRSRHRQAVAAPVEPPAYQSPEWFAEQLAERNHRLDEKARGEEDQWAVEYREDNEW